MSESEQASIEQEASTEQAVQSVPKPLSEDAILDLRDHLDTVLVSYRNIGGEIALLNVTRKALREQAAGIVNQLPNKRWSDNIGYVRYTTGWGGLRCSAKNLGILKAIATVWLSSDVLTVAACGKEVLALLEHKDDETRLQLK